MNGLAVIALKLVLQLIPVFLGRSAKRSEYERMVKSSIRVWEKRAASSSKLRQDHQKVDEELDKKAQEKWPKY